MHCAVFSERVKAIRQVGQPDSEVGYAAVHGGELLCRFILLHVKKMGLSDILDKIASRLCSSACRCVLPQ